MYVPGSIPCFYSQIKKNVSWTFAKKLISAVLFFLYIFIYLYINLFVCLFIHLIILFIYLFMYLFT